MLGQLLRTCCFPLSLNLRPVALVHLCVRCVGAATPQVGSVVISRGYFANVQQSLASVYVLFIQCFSVVFCVGELPL